MSATSDQLLSMVRAWPAPAWAAESVREARHELVQPPTMVRIDRAAALVGTGSVGSAVMSLQG